MSRTHKFFLSRMPARRANRAQHESKQWLLQCPDYSAEFPVWHVGGIRWQAAGKPRRDLKRPSCGQTDPIQLRQREME